MIPITRNPYPFSQSLKEVGMCVVINLTTACFATNPTLILAAATVQSIATLTLNACSARFQKGGYPKLESGAQWLKSGLFAISTGFNLQNLIHESGHALAFILSFQKCHPKIFLFPFAGGMTHYEKTPSTALRKWMGYSNNTLFTTISGPALTLLVSSVILYLGKTLKKQYPSFFKYSICYSLLDFAHHFEYAKSAHDSFDRTLTHDFCRLKILGIHPLMAAAAIAAIPLTILYFAKEKEGEQSPPYTVS